MKAVWNLSLSSGAWPSEWRRSNISPIPKIEVPKEFADYRGINVTPVIARSFERTIYQKYTRQVFETKINANQFAYRSGSGCIDALLTLQHSFLQALDNKDCINVRIFAMDFSKAFDNVNHALH